MVDDMNSEVIVLNKISAAKVKYPSEMSLGDTVL
jgi:hypothetical protein